MSKGLKSTSGLDARYAGALFALAEEAGRTQRIADELSQLVALAAESKEFARLLHSPLIDRKTQEEALAKVADALKLDGLTRRFLGVLAQNRRLDRLAGIRDRFADMLAAARGELTAEVVSAAPLDREAVDRLAKALGKAFSAKVRLDIETDPGIIGGLIVKVGSTMIDNSVKTKLTRFERAMKGV